jgi:hypothetical protein
MPDDLEEAYPEAAPYIREAVEEHGEEWVIEHYFPQINQLGAVMSVPDVDELPFFDPERHEAPTEEERRRRAEAYRAYLSNLRSGTKPGYGEGDRGEGDADGDENATPGSAGDDEDA